MEVNFMEYFEKNLLNKNTANYDTLREAAGIIKIKVDINCPSCARNAYNDLLNAYNRMKPAYDKYLASLVIVEPIEPIYTKYENEVLTTDILTDEPVNVTPKKTFPKGNKKV
jgi:hypothetical protein